MDQLLKQCVGIDISKKTFTACVSKYYLSDNQKLSEVFEFENQKTGFNQFVKWSRKHLDKNIPVLYLMEATGVYYEGLAYHLYKLRLTVSVILPNKARHYAAYLCVNTKNDMMDARILSTMGCLQKLPIWRPPSAIIYRQLRSLCRFQSEIKKQRTVIYNHLEALKNSQHPHPTVLKHYQKTLKQLNKSLEDTPKEIEALVKSDTVLYAKVKKIETGFMTIITIIAETQGFELITSRKQLASYAGLDVIERQSGTSICGKNRISKKGNSRIRAALYFPAMVASRYNIPLKEHYSRILMKNPKQKMIGITALQRKLLLLIDTLWKNDADFKLDRYPGMKR
jgi:transposase